MAKKKIMVDNVEFMTRNNLFMIIYLSWFPHKRFHFGTWKIKGTDETNQIDVLLVSRIFHQY